MKKGDLVIPNHDVLEKTPMIFMGKGLWRGWIRLYCPKEQKIIQVRETFVQEVKHANR